ncbi:MAG: ASKHA domain-containing protein, partial [Eggerthellaceae bacterium]|nr:ASKHA domain-containing protein [Eggerthellaceae bacterium]
MQISVHTGNAELRTISASSGQSLLSALLEAGIAMNAPCGCIKCCGRCTVLVKDSQGISPKLACREKAREDIEVFLTDLGSIVVEGAEGSLPHPDSASLLGPFGIAIDIGTSTIVFYLVDIGAQSILAASGALNPQAAFGGDVLSRIHAAASEEGLERLCSLIRAAVDEGCLALCASVGLALEDIGQIYIVGNTVMEHFAAGLDPDPIGRAPFLPQSLFGERTKLFQAEGSPALEAYLAPALAGYVGGDITAGLSMTDMQDTDKLQLFVDIGTNAEIALGSCRRILCCAAAAGPAFEGAGITWGTPAIPGAVTAVSYNEEGFVLERIGGSFARRAKPGDESEDAVSGAMRPIGICGSGVLDALACLLELGIIDEGGRILDSDCIVPPFDACITQVGDERACLLDHESRIYISQGDIREIQLAKAAIRAGIETLMASIGAASEDIAVLNLAGAFGQNMNTASAARIGLFPPELAGKVKALGNAAGKGAVAALMSKEHKQKIESIARSCEYI